MIWRGTILLLAGQISALLSGYAVNIFLARYLGPADYGVFGVVFSILMIFELFVVAGIPNALQRFVGENPNYAYSLHSYLFWRQLIYSLAFLGLAYFVAPLISEALYDDKITFLLRVAILDIVVFGLYWYFGGFLIGRSQFGRQAIIATAYSFSKLLFVVVLVLAGLGVAGAFVGNILGSFMGMIVGMFFLKLIKEKYEVPKSNINRFIIANIIYSVGLNLLFYMDLWFVKYYLSDEVVGYYTAASTLAKIPYLFSIGVSGAILPTLSFAVGQDDREEIKKVIQQTIRILLMVILPLAVLVITASSQLIHLFFGNQYSQATSIFEILFIAMSALTFFVVMNTMVVAKTGMTGCSLIVIILVLTELGLNMMLVPKLQAKGAALSTMLTMLLGLILSSGYLIRQYSVFMNVKSFMRIAGVSLIILPGANFFTASGLLELALKFVILGMAYFILLRVVGEISNLDVVSVKMSFASVSRRNNVRN